MAFYEFAVPEDTANITTDMSLTNDSGDNVGMYLVSPDGDIGGYGQNSFEGTNTLTADASTVNPTPGTWTLVVDFAGNVVGDEVSQNFTGRIRFNAASAKAPKLPTSLSTRLAAAVPVSIPVTITNKGSQGALFYLDPRLNQIVNMTLAPFSQATGLGLPLVVGSPVWFVPTETASIDTLATASLPVMFDLSPVSGDPDLGSTGISSVSCSTSSGLLYAPPGGNVGAGFWSATPSECGPYPAGTPAGTVSMSTAVTAKRFDSSTSSTTGDLELASINPASTFSPTAIQPGKSATVSLTITPSGASGTMVEGTLYVDDFLTNIPPYGQQAADEVIGIPYQYTIK